MYKRRLKVFLAIVTVGLGAVIVRVGHLQLLRGQDYRREATELLSDTEFLPAGRGAIYDRTGTHVLARDEPCFDFCLDYRFLTAEPKWIAEQQRRIARAEGLSAAEAEATYRRRSRQTWELAGAIARANGVDLEDAVERIVARVTQIRRAVGMKVRLEVEAHPVVRGLDEMLELDEAVGAEFRRSVKRLYPYGPVACHVIGTLGPVDEAELAQFNGQAPEADRVTRLRTQYLPGDEIGKRGVERLCEGLLRGVRGFRKVKDTARGTETVYSVASQTGRDVHLTLDIELQRRLTERLVSEGHNGCVVVLSIPHGEVLALVSVPTFDLNEYRRRYNELLADTVNHPLLHRAVNVLYPPGSTVKPEVALAGLADGKITTHTMIDCQGLIDPVRFPNKLRCWKYKRYGVGHGPLDVVGGIENSCNVFFGRLGGMIGPRRLCEWFAQFGFADKPGTGLPAEVPGDLPKPGERALVLADAYNMGIGQGPIALSPLHVANGIAAVARGGEFRSPIVVLEGGPPQVRRQLGFAPEYIRAVHEGMHKVTSGANGTAARIFREANLGVEVGGKSGTADVPGRAGDMAWFAGFAPYGHPRVAFAVVLEYTSGGGSHDAGPIAIDLIRMCKELGYLD